MTVAGISLDPKMVWLFGGVTALLVLASLIGFALSRAVTSETGQATVRNLNARIKAWWGMVAVFAVAFTFGKIVTILLFALVSFYCLREFISLTPTRPADHRAIVVAFYFFIPYQYWLVSIGWVTMLTIGIPVFAFLLLPVLSVTKGETDDFLQRTAKIQWALMLTVFCISHAPALLILNIPGYQNKVAPKVSPSKTVEGLVGGGLAATGIGAALWWITPFTPLAAAGMAAAIVAAGFLGGLVLSAVKRSLGAKDWGTMIEGHGGALDRMDSVSFAAPLFFHLVNYYYTV